MDVLPATDTRPQRRTLLVSSAGTLLVLVAFVTPLITGVRTATSFDAGPGTVAWLLSAMSVGLAAALLPAGALADDIGRRTVFCIGLLLVGAGGVVAAVAPGGAVFLAGRLVAGIGGAAALASALGLIGHVFPAGPERARAAAVWGASVGAGTGIGGLLAVALDHGTSWRITYGVTAGLVAAVAAAARLVLPESAAAVHRRPDVLGALLLAAGLSSLLAGLVQSRGGWTDPGTLLPIGGGLVLVALFVAAESRVREPMIDLALFRVPGFSAAIVGAVVTGAAVIGVSSYVPTILQRGLGDTLLAATLLILVWSVAGTVTALALRWLSGVDGRLLLAGALVVSAAGLAGLAVLDPGTPSTHLLPGLFVLGIGYGGANAALGREAVAHVPTARAAMGSGANNTARYIGAALGVTLVVLIVAAAGPATDPAALTAGWNHAALAAAALALAGAGVIAVIRPGRG